MIPRVQTAVDIKKAIEKASELTEIGFDASVLKQGYLDIMETFDTYLADRDLLPDPDENENTLVVPGGGKIDKTQMGLVEELSDLNIMHQDWKSGWLNERIYSLRVTCSGCDFEGVINSDLEDLLPQWYENFHTSGFGNVKTQETEINVDVRNAREISSSEFTVDQKLISDVQWLWSYCFLPKRVNATPYKIHIYGPGGQFKPHMDTPERNLVGTFLLGLGDTTEPGEHLVLNGEARYGSTTNHWVAFYPDIPHEVTRIESGYRAVIAFKIFRHDDAPETPLTGVSETVTGTPESLSSNFVNVDMLVAVESILAKLCAAGKPFAFHLTHLYNKSLIEPVGFDNILLIAASKQQPTLIRLLPVLCQRRFARVEDEDGDFPDDELKEANTVTSSVYPFTDAHMDFLLGDKGALERDSVQWLKGVKEIPFWNLLGHRWKAGVMWSHEYNEGPGFTGNESRAHDEYSVYLSWAVIVFPNPAGFCV